MLPAWLPEAGVGPVVVVVTVLGVPCTVVVVVVLRCACVCAWLPMATLLSGVATERTPTATVFAPIACDAAPIAVALSPLAQVISFASTAPSASRSIHDPMAVVFFPEAVASSPTATAPFACALASGPQASESTPVEVLSIGSGLFASSTSRQLPPAKAGPARADSRAMLSRRRFGRVDRRIGDMAVLALGKEARHRVRPTPTLAWPRPRGLKAPSQPALRDHSSMTEPPQVDEIRRETPQSLVGEGCGAASDNS